MTRRLVVAAGLLALLSAGAFAFVLVPRAMRRTSGGFAAYYTAARILREGNDAVRLYDDAWFRARVEELVPGASEIYFVNPPTTALAALPLSGLPPQAARGVFVILSALALAASLRVFARELLPPRFLLFGFIAFALACQPVRVDLREGQVYSILLLLLVLAWSAYRGGRDVVAGICLGLLLVFKLAALPVWIVAAAGRRLRVVVTGLATAALVAALSWPRLGIASWREFVAYGRRWSREPAMAVTAHQSNMSLLKHLLRYDARVSPHPLVDAPLLAAALAAGLALAFALFLWRLVRRDRTGDLAFAAAAAMGLAVTPVSQGYSYVLALLPISVLLFRRLDRLAFAALALSLALVGVWFLPFREDAGPLLTLLSYPKLLAAWILFALAVREGALAPSTTAPAAGSGTG